MSSSMTNEQLLAEIDRIKAEHPDVQMPTISFEDDDTLRLEMPDQESLEQLLTEMRRLDEPDATH